LAELFPKFCEVLLLVLAEVKVPKESSAKGSEVLFWVSFGGIAVETFDVKSPKGSELKLFIGIEANGSNVSELIGFCMEAWALESEDRLGSGAEKKSVVVEENAGVQFASLEKISMSICQ
jgi:hypothetical protein